MASDPHPATPGRKIYASTACLARQQLGLWGTLHAYREAGVTAVELGSGARPDEVDGELAGRLRAERLDLLVHNYFPPPAEPFVLNLASADSGIATRSLAQVERALVLTAELGAPFYSVHGGFVTDPDWFDGQSFVFPAPSSADEQDQATERFLGSLQTVLTRATELGVGLLVENNVCTEDLRGRLLLQTAEEFGALFRAVQAPALGMLLDTGHLNVSATTLGFDRESFVNEVAAHVRAVHAHENDGLADAHRPLSPDGWALSLLRSGELSSAVVVVEAEFHHADALSRHVSWLNEALR